MSLDLYTTALIWYAQRGGVAKLWGRMIPLLEAPPLLGLRLVMVEYRPEIGERRLQPYDGPARDMTPDECAAAHRLLVQMVQDARDALAGQSTLAVVHG